MLLENYLETYPVTLKWFPNVIYGFVFSLSVYLAAYRNLDVQTDYLEEMRFFNEIDEFDFIIGERTCTSNKSVIFWHYIFFYL